MESFTLKACPGVEVDHIVEGVGHRKFVVDNFMTGKEFWYTLW